ncbi:hypothetical protein FACS189499_03010 [Clostridia bacterium]|nr:hypothetical protein FACS189499_03010 [Clostridia bacterium]
MNATVNAGNVNTRLRKTNLPIFIPHAGCKNSCSFCDQHAISGTAEPVSPADIGSVIERQIPFLSGKFTAEIAFFGGSFTALPASYMTELLSAADVYLEKYPHIFTGIRISTRPDCIDEDVLGVLKQHSVTAVEIGAQSMDDEVLALNLRGHTSDDVREAVRRIKGHGFDTGVQMMTGLYGDTPLKVIKTAQELSALKPDTARIYPTVIMPGTLLGELYTAGRYDTFTEEETVRLCAECYRIFTANGVRVIRIGLHFDEELKSNMLGGVLDANLGDKVRRIAQLNGIN